MGSAGGDSRLTQSKDNQSVKEDMGFSYEVESDIYIFKLMVSDYSHRIKVVHASINTKRYRKC